MLLLNRMEFLERLVDNVVLVNFTKVSGEPRSMRCTLRADMLPPQVDIEESKSPKTNTDRMIVWDVEKEAWRSFRLDSVTSVLTPAPEKDNTEIGS